MITSEKFNPGINRVTLASHPLLPKGIAGSEAHTWLATWGLAQRMREEVSALKIPDLKALNIVDRAEILIEYLNAFDELLQIGNPEAEDFAYKLGLVLTTFIYTLKKAPLESRVMRKEWPESHWDAWSKVKRVNVGGGRFETLLGDTMLKVAISRLHDFGVGDVDLVAFKYPQYLPCFGVASSLPDGSALILDAGHTLIKRIKVEVKDGKVIRFEILSPLRPFAQSPGQSLEDYIVEGFKEIHSTETNFGLSLSVYLDENGYAIPGSLYSPLSATDPVNDVIAKLLSDAGIYAKCIKVFHEGKASMMLHQADASILLGTSIGGGVNTRIIK